MGIKAMNSLMQPYKEGNLDKIDIYLLQGIYAKEPDELEIQQFEEDDEDPTCNNRNSVQSKRSEIAKELNTS